MFDGSDSQHKIPTHLRWLFASLFLLWAGVIGGSLIWNLTDLHSKNDEVALSEARVIYDMDLTYRRWSSLHGGVYVPIDSTTPPNPYLTQVNERDIATPLGRKLTLVNPAYMTRQVHELFEQTEGLKGHITSLKPIRPENKADEWETSALASFETGDSEAFCFAQVNGQEYIRLMKPLTTELACLKCHSQQGYKEGDVRGGISVSVPMLPLRIAEQARSNTLMLAHLAIWGIGSILIGTFWRMFSGAEVKRITAFEEREKSLEQLNQALANVKVLTGMLPICASCKKVRDDTGYWTQVDTYITKHTEVLFSHGICPDCMQKLYPDVCEELEEQPHSHN